MATTKGRKFTIWAGTLIFTSPVIYLSLISLHSQMAAWVVERLGDVLKRRVHIDSVLSLLVKQPDWWWSMVAWIAAAVILGGLIEYLSQTKSTGKGAQK